MKTRAILCALVPVGAVFCGLIGPFASQINAGLVARYSFDGDFRDSSGYGYDATSPRPPVFNSTDASFGSSVDFEADNWNLLQVAHNPVFSSMDDMTIAMWLKPESLDGGSRRVLQKGRELDWRLQNRERMEFNQNDRTAFASVNSTELTPLGQWTHIAAVVDSGSDAIMIYANGTEVARESLEGRGIDRTNRTLFIGAKENNNYHGDYFDGLMDEFHIYSDALTSSQISELMATNTISTLPPPPPPPPPTNSAIEVSALIDGRDQLIVRDGTLQWEHFENAAVGRHQGNVPTTVTTTLEGRTIMDHVEWFPQWSHPTDQIRHHEFSSVFADLTPEFPKFEQIVRLSLLQVRREVTIVQQPSVDNDYTLIVEFDDNYASGSEMYTVRLDYRDSPSWEIPLRSIGVVDIAAEFIPVGGDHGRGEFTAAGQANVAVEDDGERTCHIDGAFEMTASLSVDNSAGGWANGKFNRGALAFRDSNGSDLLSGDLIWLRLFEVGNESGMLAGDGLFEVTGGSLENEFLETHGEVFQMFFEVEPGSLNDFSDAFTGFMDITITPIPEPATLGMLALGALAVLRRRKRRR